MGIDKDGGWHLADPSGTARLEAIGEPVHLLTPGGRLRTATGTEMTVDAVFPVLHGPWGEDGTVQGLFEVAGLPYVGAGVLGSAVGMDKDIAKRLFRDAGLPVTNSVVVRSAEWDDAPGDVTARLIDALGLPMFVKPTTLGSSVGISKVTDRDGIKPALALALEHGRKALVEEGVAGREIEVAVLDGPRMSVPGEIIPPEGSWYDYEAKYQDEGTTLHVPADLRPEETEFVRSLAGKAFSVLDLAGLARVDFFFEEGGRGFLLNEVNTMPGMTARSMFPLLWEATGIKYPDLIDGLVRTAIG